MCLSAERPLSLCVCETLIFFPPSESLSNWALSGVGDTHTVDDTTKPISHSGDFQTQLLFDRPDVARPLVGLTVEFLPALREKHVASVCPTSVCRLKFNIVSTREMYSPPNTARCPKRTAAKTRRFFQFSLRIYIHASRWMFISTRKTRGETIFVNSPRRIFSISHAFFSLRAKQSLAVQSSRSNTRSRSSDVIKTNERDFFRFEFRSIRVPIEHFSLSR